MSLVTANGVGADETDLPGRLVATLVDGRPHAEALELLDETQRRITHTTKHVQMQREVTDRLAGAFVLLERGLPAGNGATPTPIQRCMLGEVASLCVSLAELIGGREPFWLFVVRALRAECLHLTGDTAGAEQAARRALETYAQLTEPDPVTDEFHTLIRNLLDSNTVLVTTPHLIAQLASRV